jgi:peptidoglycan/LPS O-acetylase OafA/YrhL
VQSFLQFLLRFAIRGSILATLPASKSALLADSMNKNFSLYLDVVRFFAAILVVIAHFCQLGFVSEQAKQFLPQCGREAVVIFFVLSGFVIAYTAAEKKANLRQYAVARCARIYSAALPIMLATLVAVTLATLVFGKQVSGSYQLSKIYIYLPMHLLFTGELWNLSQTPPWLVPYWSLGYEVWYYVLFGAMLYARGKVRIALVAALLLIMGHKLWLLLPVWMSGVYLYRYQKPLRMRVDQARLAWLLTILALVLYKISGADDWLRTLGNSAWPFANLKLGSADRYLADYAVCVLVYLNFLFARHAELTQIEPVSTHIRRVAAYTFTLYLVHAPVMGIWRAFYNHDNANWLDIGALAGCIGLACYLFGFVTERRRTWFQSAFDKLLSIAIRHFDAIRVTRKHPASA